MLVFPFGRKKVLGFSVNQTHLDKPIIKNKIDILKTKAIFQENVIPNKKTLVGLAIKQTMLEFGEPAYNKVVQTLYFEYHCNLDDCYEHPKNLKAALQKIYGNAHKVIMESIKERIEKLNMNITIPEFLISISS